MPPTASRPHTPAIPPAAPVPTLLADTLALERAGNSRAALAALKARLEAGGLSAEEALDLHLAAANNEFLLCDYRAAHERLTAASRMAAAGGHARAAARAQLLMARTLHQQGNRQAAVALAGEATARLEALGDFANAARAGQTLAYVALDRGEYAQAIAHAERCLALAQRSGDAYCEGGMGVTLGIALFTLGASRQPIAHARAHPHVLELADVQADKTDLLRAKTVLEQAMRTFREAGFEAQADTFSGRLDRVNILLGEVDETLKRCPRQIQRMQANGNVHEEIGFRQTLAWALRLKGQFAEALLQLDAVLRLARKIGTLSRSVEYAHYDRSLVLSAMGRHEEAQASYRAYLRFVSAWNRRQASGTTPAPAIEPWFLKRADAYMQARLAAELSLDDMAAECGTSVRSLQAYFRKFRGVSPMAQWRNLRLDAAATALREGALPVASVAAAHGFASATTFSAEFKRRFGHSPVEARRERRAA